MSASIWAPGTAISASGSVQNQAFTATAGQTLFTLTTFAYEPSVGSLAVYVSGLAQRPGIDFTETSSSSFTLTTAVEDGTIVLAVGQTEIVATVPVVGADLPTIGASNFVRANAGATAFEGRTPAQVLSDIGAQAADAQLTDIAGLTPTDNGVVIGNGANFVVESGATLKTSLGLTIGTDVQAYDVDTAKLDVDQAWTGSNRATPTTDNDGSFDMNAAMDFLCTPSAGFTLTFTNITQGQRGCIYLVNGSNYAIAAAATTKVTNSFLSAVSATGEYWISYWSPDGTNVLVAHAGDFA
jgi:hypothetical protein